MTAMDYEFQPANHLAFRCADLVAVPDVFPLDMLRRQGAPLNKTWRYTGLKEQIALAGFEPNPEYCRQVGIDTSRPVVVVRPPADMALYHRFQNPLFTQSLMVLRTLCHDHRVSVVLLARTCEQAESLESEGFADLLWRGETLDGRQLVAGADAVMSAGGSMNREAAVLGTPAYSIYAGKLAAVDRALVAQGALTLVRSSRDIEELRFVKKPPLPFLRVNDDLLTQFVNKVLELACR